MPSGRIRSVAALVSVAVLVALFVLVFRGFTAGHTSSNPASPQTTKTNNTTPITGQWTNIPGLANEKALPRPCPQRPARRL